MSIVRQAKNNYLLASDEVLSSLKNYSTPIEKRLNYGLSVTKVKNIRTGVFKDIIAHWPNGNLDKEKAERVTYELTDACSF